MSELARSRNAEHDKIQPLVFRLCRTRVIAGAHRNEEFTGERQLQASLDVVEENRDGYRRMRKHDFPEEVCEPLLADQHAFLLPPGLQIDLEPELADDAIRDAVVPATGFGALAACANLAQVDDGRQLVLGPQLQNRAGHQARFAAAPRTQRVAESARAKALRELLISRTRYIALSIGLHRAADDEEICALIDSWHQPFSHSSRLAEPNLALLGSNAETTANRSSVAAPPRRPAGIGSHSEDNIAAQSAL